MRRIGIIIGMQMWKSIESNRQLNLFRFSMGFFPNTIYTNMITIKLCIELLFLTAAIEMKPPSSLHSIQCVAFQIMGIILFLRDGSLLLFFFRLVI